MVKSRMKTIHYFILFKEIHFTIYPLNILPVVYHSSLSPDELVQQLELQIINQEIRKIRDVPAFKIDQAKESFINRYALD